MEEYMSKQREGIARFLSAYDYHINSIDNPDEIVQAIEYVLKLIQEKRQKSCRNSLQEKSIKKTQELASLQAEKQNEDLIRDAEDLVLSIRDRLAYLHNINK